MLDSRAVNFRAIGWNGGDRFVSQNLFLCFMRD